MKLSGSTASLWKQRIGYGSADFACNLIWQMISLYLLFFYTDIMQLSLGAISTMFLVTRFIDAITDILVGYAIDHTNTRWGKSRPYFLFGAIPFAVFAIMAFTVPNLDADGKLIYAYVSYIGLSFLYTVVNIPLASILPSLTDDANERTNLSTSRKFFGFLGATIVSACSLSLVGVFGGGDDALGYQRVMILFGVIGSLIFFFTFATVREKNTLSPRTKSPGLFVMIKSLQQNTPWKIFAVNILFMWTAFFIQASALIYYFTYYVGDTTLAATVMTILSIIPMLVNFLVPAAARKMGKRNLFVASSLVQIIGTVLLYLSGTLTSAILASIVIMAIGSGMKESIYFSIQADPVDYGEWKTGVNTAGLLSSVNGFLGKCSQAIAGGIGGYLLESSGYIPKAAQQSAEAITAIQAMYIYIPIILTVASIFIMLSYKLDAEYPRIKKELDARAKQQAITMEDSANGIHLSSQS